MAISGHLQASPCIIDAFSLTVNHTRKHAKYNNLYIIIECSPNQRLLMYQRIFNTTTPIELHGTYIWSVKVAAAIQPLLSTLEVALRNSIHTCGTQFIAPNWYEVLSTR